MVNIHFTLTYSEYREFHRRRLQFPDHSATIGLTVIFALLSVLFLVSGLRLIDDTNAARIGLWMVIGSIVMVAAIPLFVLWRKKRDQQKSDRMLRAEFENVKHEVREFEADERGWKFRWRGGEDVRPWNLFRGFWDEGLAVRLASSYNEYWLPKRAFTPEQFAELKNLVNKIYVARESERDYLCLFAPDRTRFHRRTCIASMAIPLLWGSPHRNGGRVGRIYHRSSGSLDTARLGLGRYDPRDMRLCI